MELFYFLINFKKPDHRFFINLIKMSKKLMDLKKGNNVNKILAGLLLSFSTHLFASLASPIPENLTQMTGFKSSLCDSDIIPGYIDDLLIDSKFDASDETKSNEIEIDPVSEAKKALLYDFAKSITKYSDQAYLSINEVDRLRATACLHDTLLEWASVDAIMSSDTTKTGIAMRKWVLGSMSAALIKMRGVYLDFHLDPSILVWLNDLGMTVIAEHIDRLNEQSMLINNHDYFAAFATGATYIITGNPAFYDYTNNLFHFAMTQVEGKKKMAWLPNEIARGELAEDYSNFALVPLGHLE